MIKNILKPVYIQQFLVSIRSYASTVDKVALSKLRKKTGIGFMNCKKALEKFENDIEKAEKWLSEQAQKEGWARATKLQGRPMSQGLIGIVSDKQRATMLEVNCETDFVARNANFHELVSQVAVGCHNYFMAAPFSTMCSLSGIEEIPDPVLKPVRKKLADGVYTWVFFDLETTGLGLADITQMSAKTGDKTFNKYALPEKRISKEASRVTGITFQNGTLYKDNEPVDAVSIQQCLCEFADWLNQFSSPVLVAHNARFDGTVLCNCLLKTKDRRLAGLVEGFSDSLSLFRSIIKSRKSYSQESLVHDLLGEEYRAHDAAEDVANLQKLVTLQRISDELMCVHSYSLSYLMDCVEYKTQKDQNLKSLRKLVRRKVVTKVLASRIAESGLELKHLVLAHHRDALEETLTEICDGKPRVTNDKHIINKLSEYLNSVVSLQKDKLDNLEVGDGKKVSDLIALTIGNIGENMMARRVTHVGASDHSILATYLHWTGPSLEINNCRMGKFGIVLDVSQTLEGTAEVDNIETVSNNLCKHVLGYNPKTVGALEYEEAMRKREIEKSKVEEDSVGSENPDGTDDKKDVSKSDSDSSSDSDSDSSSDSDSDSEIEPKTKEDDETRLLFQEYIMDTSVTVGEYLKENHSTVNKFVRFECGEDLPSDDS